MTRTTKIPEYLTPALARLDEARATHLERARQLDDTLTAITRITEQKAGLEQNSGSETLTWRTAFRAGGAVLTEELKQRHLEQVARRELAQECDNLAEVLSFECDEHKVACNESARKFRQAHHAVLKEYAVAELEHALNDTVGALIRAMTLKITVMENPMDNTVGHQGYTEPDKVVMHEVMSFLASRVKTFTITPDNEPVLSVTGFPLRELPHMHNDAPGTLIQRKVWQEKMRTRRADLKARGLLP